MSSEGAVTSLTAKSRGSQHLSRAARTLQPTLVSQKRGRMSADLHGATSARLAPATIEALLGYAARATWPVGFVIYQRGTPADGVFVVLEGRVVLRSRVRAGRGFIPWIATPGETFGGEGLSATPHYATEARAD